MKPDPQPPPQPLEHGASHDVCGYAGPPKLICKLRGMSHGLGTSCDMSPHSAQYRAIKRSLLNECRWGRDKRLGCFCQEVCEGNGSHDITDRAPQVLSSRHSQIMSPFESLGWEDAVRSAVLRCWREMVTLLGQRAALPMRKEGSEVICEGPGTRVRGEPAGILSCILSGAERTQAHAERNCY